MSEQRLCGEQISFGDDVGDNEATFTCALPAGHEGEHVEAGQLDKRTEYRLAWTVKMVTARRRERAAARR